MCEPEERRLGGGGLRNGGGTTIFSYIRRLGLFFGVQIFIFQYFLGFLEMNMFLGMKISWIFFGGHHKTGLVLGVISFHLRTFF